MQRLNIHGTGVMLGGRGVIFRGASGTGKSLLALELLERYARSGRPAMLVADDRLDLHVTDGALLMSAPPAIAGLIELRGRGIISRPYQAAAQAHLVVDLVETLERMVDEGDLRTSLCDIYLARCPVPRRGIVDSAHQMLLVAEALANLA